ncbi:MAG: ABC transporter ATP-binding protein [Planctomycetota bacterium]
MTSADADLVIDAKGIEVRFGRGSRRAPRVEALRGVDLRCARGETVGLLGPNGSGKTSLLRVLCGDLAPDAGRVRILGRAPGDRSLVLRVGFQPDEAPPFPNLTPIEILEHLGGLAGLPRMRAKERGAALLTRLGLSHVTDRALAGFSTGMKRRTAIACALLGEPELLLLDEPTSGLDPVGSLLVLDMLREATARGATVVMASHRLDEIELACDRVVILANGRVHREGSLDQLLGTGVQELGLRGVAPAARSAIEDAARAAGAEVVGWTEERRHLYGLLREIDAGDGIR